MTTKAEIIDAIARDRVVETMVSNIAHQPMNADLKDLSQMVYLILLEYDDDKIRDIWEHNEIRFFLARIIINQFRSTNSPFHLIYRQFREKSEDITNKDWIDE